MPSMMRLRSITLLSDRVKDWSVYPFVVPAIQCLESLEIRSRICFFVGENGSGKSTLFERSPTTTVLAARVEAETSTRQQPTVLGVLVHSRKHCAWPLAPAQGGASTSGPRVSSMWQPRSTRWARKMGTEAAAYMNNPTGNRFYLCLKTAFSVPDSMSSTSREAALSPQRQLSMPALLRTLLSGNNDIQFLIASHSPILLAYPGAQIFSFDKGILTRFDIRRRARTKL